MFIRRLSKLFMCVILLFLLFEKSNAYYIKKDGTPYYIQLVRPILKRLQQVQLPPLPPTNGTYAYIPPKENKDKECPMNDSDTDCEQKEINKKGHGPIYERKNQIDDCRVNDDDCQEYSYETNKRPVKVDKLDKKILEVLFNMELLETDTNQEMYDQRFRK